jgi:glutaryl-CoA dehydrogenase
MPEIDSAAKAPPLDPHDPLALDAEISDEERLIRDTVRRYVRERFLPRIAEAFEAAEFPREVPRELGALGLLGMHLSG